MERRVGGGFVIALLKIIVIGFSISSQRAALGAGIAMPPQAETLAAGKPGVNGEQIAQVQIAQVLPIINDDAPAGHDTATAGSSTEPQAGTRESISVATQRRRRPKMAGVPSGTQTVAQPSEESAPATQQADAGKAEMSTAGSSIPAAPSTIEQAAVANVSSDTADNEEPDMGEDNSPGAIARRNAERAQGIGRKYQMAPIRWGGQIIELVAMRRSKNFGTFGILSPIQGPVSLSPTPSTIYHIQGVKTQAATYVLKPWIATIKGRLGVVQQNIQKTSGQQNDNTKNQITGGGDASLFSQSRYPFSINYDVVDSRINDQLVDSNSNLDSVSKTLSLSQTYRPIKGPEHYRFNYSQSNAVYHNVSFYNANQQLQQRTSNFSTASSSLNASYATQLGRAQDQPFNLSVFHSTFSNSYYAASGLTRSGITASHTYVPEDSLLTLNNSGSYFENKQTGLTSQNLSLSSQATWQPEDIDNPLILRGGVRFFNAKNQVANLPASDTKILGATVNATYNKWAHITLRGGGSLTGTSFNGASSNISATQFADIRYRPDRVHLAGGGTYTRTALAGFLNQMSSNAPSRVSTHATAQQGLSAPFALQLLGYDTHLTTNLSQSLSMRQQSGSTSETLAHYGAVTWVPLGLRQRLPSARTGGKKGVRAQSSGAANLISSITLRANDTRTFGATQSHTQSFSLGAGAGAGGAYSASGSGYGGTADARIEITRTTSGNATGGLTGNASWGHVFVYTYSYRKAKVFDVSGLNYGLSFSANIDPQLRARTQQNLQTSQTVGSTAQYLGYGVSLIQGLQYRVGQNEALLTASLSNNYGFNTASLFLRFRAWRNFGN